MSENNYEFEIPEEEINYTAFVYAVRKILLIDEEFNNVDPATGRMAQGGIDAIPANEEEYLENWWFKDPLTMELVDIDKSILPPYEGVLVEWEYQKEHVRREFINGHQIGLRVEAYGEINDQLDEMYHDYDAWKSRIQSIKDRYPKVP